MRRSDTSKGSRIIAGVMGLMMLMIVLFSAFYIAAEAEHDCCGEDCPVCVCIRQCENILRGVADGTAAQLSFIVPVLLVLLIAGALAAAVPQDTPVSGKVRLNN